MDNSFDNKKKYIYIGIIALLIIAIIGVSFAFFNYTRIGAVNRISTGTIIFEYIDGSTLNIENQSPISESEATTGTDNKLTFSIRAYNTLTNGVTYNVYAVQGDAVAGKTNRLRDDVMAFKFVPAADGNGFTTTTNNYATAKSLEFVNGKALISTGTIKNTTAETTKTYEAYLWPDVNKIFVSSTTKRATLPEGNPSLADATTGTATANRYVKNDSTLKEVTLYPAVTEAIGKIIYTTNEFSNSYYSIKIQVEAYDNAS